MSDGDVVATFMAISGCSEDEAVDYLSTANFDLGLAQTLYESDHNLHDNRPARPETSSVVSLESPTAPYLVERLDGGVGSVTESVPLERPQPPSAMDLMSVLFIPPQFVYTGSRPFTEFCRRAFEKDQWVLLSFLGDDFVSLCVNRDVWKCEAARETLNMFSIYQIAASTETAELLAHGYRLDLTRDVPALLIISPVTTKKESRVPLNMSGVVMDANGVNEYLLSFVGEHGSPSQWEERRVLSAIPDATSGPPAIDASGVSNTNSSPALQPTKPTIVPLVEPIDISLYEVTAGEKHVFALRCRLPKQQLTLRLKPETPAYLLAKYLAYRAYQDDPEAYPHGVPNCSLKTGFPPRTVDIEDEKVSLATWGRVTSGDTVFLHIEETSSS